MNCFLTICGYDPDKSCAVRPVVSLTPKIAPTVEKTEGEGEQKITYWAFN